MWCNITGEKTQNINHVIAFHCIFKFYYLVINFFSGQQYLKSLGSCDSGHFICHWSPDT